MQVLNLKNANSLYKGNNKVLKLYRGNNLLYEKVEEINDFIILYGGRNSKGVRFLNPITLEEVYYLDTGFPVFSITYTQNNVFALTRRYSGDMSIYLYQLDKNNNSFVLRDTISEINGESIESFGNYSSSKQTVFYCNNNLYCFRGPSKKYSGDFGMKYINYDFNNFCILNADDCYVTLSNPSVYSVETEGNFQTINNYILTLDNIGTIINIYEINSSYVSSLKVYMNFHDILVAYPISGSAYLAIRGSDGNLYLGGSSYTTKISSNIGFLGTSLYSKFSYFNNRYYINGGKNRGIVEINVNDLSLIDLSDRMNMGQNGDLDSIIVSSKGNFYLKGSNIIKSYDSNYNLLLTKDNSSYSNYKVIDTVSL